MNDNREIRCIEKAHEAKVSSALRHLEILQKNGKTFENPLSGFSLDVDWNKTWKGRVKQASFIPIVYVFMAFLALIVPVMYIFHLWEIHNEKSNLKREVFRTNVKLSSIESSGIKTLEVLWQLHGLDEYKYNSDERIELLSKWIEILYGKKNLNLNQRLETIITDHVKANRSYYKGKKNASHFHFVSPITSLIRELSKELKKYDANMPNKANREGLR